MSVNIFLQKGSYGMVQLAYNKSDNLHYVRICNLKFVKRKTKLSKKFMYFL